MSLPFLGRENVASVDAIKLCLAVPRYFAIILRWLVGDVNVARCVFAGCGSVAPKSTWGKVATMVYAVIGIPLTLIYLSSMGGLLSRIARGVFTRALCCCLCSNCGYCCYDERRMQVSERGVTLPV